MFFSEKLYSIKKLIFSCDANNFRISRSQRRVIRNMNLFINENIKPGAQIHSISSNSNTCDLQEWIQTEPSTRAIELIRHILLNDTRRMIEISLNKHLFDVE